jgi:hypothetical protein
MNACATGLADCVIMLHGKGADLKKVDKWKRGCLQLARNCQGKNQKLATWLEEKVPGIYSSKISAGGWVGGGCVRVGGGGRVWTGSCECGCVSGYGSLAGYVGLGLVLLFIFLVASVGVSGAGGFGSVGMGAAGCGCVRIFGCVLVGVLAWVGAGPGPGSGSGCR